MRLLRETYGQMTEDEICAGAEDTYELTPIALEALQSEISERKLNIQVKTAPPAPPKIQPLADMDLVVINLFRDAGEARAAKEILNAAGVISYLGPENLTNLDEFNGNFEIGVELKVASFNYQRAMAALVKARSESDTEEAAGESDPEENEDYAVLCPRCRSSAIVFEGRVPAPGLESKFTWTCDACGHQWQDDGVSQPM